VECLTAVVPQGSEAQLQIGPPAVELVKVEEEVDLDLAFVVGELAELAATSNGPSPSSSMPRTGARAGPLPFSPR
jgi:hypothetical protein